MNCPHCKFMEELFLKDDIKSNREYWIMTEVFVYLHGGKDYCDEMLKKKQYFRKMAKQLGKSARKIREKSIREALSNNQS